MNTPRSIIDLSKRLTIHPPRAGEEYREIRPFIRIKDSKGEVHIFWLEYCALDEPNDMLINSDFHPSADQKQETYTSRATFEVCLKDGKMLKPESFWASGGIVEVPARRERLLAYHVTCERIPDGDIGIVRLSNGCLWTMIPKAET